jgi:hypothetical protein
MQDFTFLIVDPGQGEPTVPLVAAESERWARDLAERWLDLSPQGLRAEAHESGEALFVVKRAVVEV